MKRDYATLRASLATIDEELSAISAKLNAPEFPRLANGLAPDHVRAMPEYKALRAQYARGFDKLRTLNAELVKRFPKELRASRDAAREAKRKANLDG